MKKNIERLLILASCTLVVSAVFLGIQIYKQYQLQQSQFHMAQTQKNKDAEAQKVLSTLMQPTPGPITNDEQQVLDFPPDDASDAMKKRFASVVAKFAQPAALLDISGCMPKPLDMKLSLATQSLIIRNGDSIPHTLTFSSNRKIVILPKSQKTILGIFDRGPGTYGYGCDVSMGAAGIILAIP